VRYQFIVLDVLVASLALAAVMMVAGCSPAVKSVVENRHMQPLSEGMLADLKNKKMKEGSPIIMRIFKEESELEVWKYDESGRFALLRTYPICRWSGELGPKIRSGDRQAPEGFYTITPSQMNPNSSRYLAINTGFPNGYDKANGRTGDFLMIHGDCSSAGCYAMTDGQIAEIYALAREAFFGGQKSFQLQAYPFRMTALNMARHRNSPHMAFWKMLKQGYDHFEVTHLEPKVDVCEKRYVINAQATEHFSAADHCPPYKVPEDLAATVFQKQRRDDIETTRLVIRGIATAPVTSGGAGGMNPIFRASVNSQVNPETVDHSSSGMGSADESFTGMPSTSSTASVE
jgi:murein L,D-transpeptidase YafK